VVTLQYSVPTVPKVEGKAFSEEGSSFTLIPDRLYSKLYYSIHGPPGYRFEIITPLTVLNVDGSREQLEEKLCRALYNPTVDENDPTLLKWEIQWPIPGYKYICRYKLRSTSR
jgi:hypothetical protein